MQHDAHWSIQVATDPQSENWSPRQLAGLAVNRMPLFNVKPIMNEIAKLVQSLHVLLYHDDDAAMVEVPRKLGLTLGRNSISPHLTREGSHSVFLQPIANIRRYVAIHEYLFQQN